MAVTQIGLVYYLDDATHAVFRKVYPTLDDSELDGIRWVTEGCDPARLAVMQRVPIESPEAQAEMTGTP